MRVYAKLVSLTHPSFHLSHPTVDSFTWNTLIRAHAQSEDRPAISAVSSLSVYMRMRCHGVEPDFHTFPFLLQSFDSPSHLHFGRQVHAHILCLGLVSDPFIQTSLICMYSSCGDSNYAHQVFDEIPNPDLPTWNSIIASNVKIGLISTARQIFDRMPQRNVISWSCMINGYMRCGKYREALSLFREMQSLELDTVRPNEFTMSSVLSACGRLGALEHGKWAHTYIDKCGMEMNVVLGTSLIDMYAKCGSIEKARSVFDNLGPKKDVMAWSAMISGLAMHGLGEECFAIFSRMQDQGIRPNAVTFLGILCACVHGGLVSEGKAYFKRMSEEFGITPLIQHYGCIVDLYGRAGLIDEALNVVKSMPMKPDVPVWGALLSSSRMHGSIKTCELSLKQLIKLEPSNSGAYVLLSNVYAKMGRWEDVRYVRDQMEAKGIKKLPGCSLVEVGGILHEFLVGDESHPEAREIYLMLEEMMKRLKMEGYVGKTGEVLLDLDEEGRELALSFHSEKLAVAFAFLKTSPGTPIRIVKNLRICSDCHDFIKMVSRIFDREVIIRDCNRFHYFTHGLCSCKDYW
ncbi:pentatricopeptide repeat-containing protein At3g62890-like [Telopea speciosissima]|uniref:pentatricopeptide repeat-containing protein At3g62890-like n=1 Tax=Telopea speciosissima TaxID=54955 RepID=UPI001CC568C9|nr:pentatricopeptide repeat-containing protein At3g62890-like [Telopea speciosissima]